MVSEPSGAATARRPRLAGPDFIRTNSGPLLR
jgi:hypothetical protein